MRRNTDQLIYQTLVVEIVNNMHVINGRIDRWIVVQFYFLFLPLLHILFILLVHKAKLLAVDEDATNAQEASIHVDEASVDVEEASVDVEEASVDGEEASVDVKEASVDAEDAAVDANKAAVEDLLFLGNGGSRHQKATHNLR